MPADREDFVELYENGAAPPSSTGEASRPHVRSSSKALRSVRTPPVGLGWKEAGLQALFLALEWWERRRTLHALKGLSDRTLKDIGLHRSGLWEPAARAAERRRLERMGKRGIRASGKGEVRHREH